MERHERDRNGQIKWRRGKKKQVRKGIQGRTTNTKGHLRDYVETY